MSRLSLVSNSYTSLKWLRVSTFLPSVVLSLKNIVCMRNPLPNISEYRSLSSSTFAPIGVHRFSVSVSDLIMLKPPQHSRAKSKEPMKTLAGLRATIRPHDSMPTAQACSTHANAEHALLIASIALALHFGSLDSCSFPGRFGLL